MLETAFQNGPGEEIINSSQPNSKGRRQYGTVGPRVHTPLIIDQERNAGQVLSLSEDVDMTDLQVEPTPHSSDGLEFTQNAQPVPVFNTLPSQDMPGNFLGLPIVIDLVTGAESRMSWPRNIDFVQVKHEKTQKLIQASPLKPQNTMIFPLPEPWTIWARNESISPPAEMSQIASEFTCQRPGIVASMNPFEEGCKIMCWAACRKVESALEDKKNAGRFTEAFTEFLTRPKNNEETQLPRSTEVLISHLRVKFVNYNEEARKNKWAEQHPKLFISTGLQPEDYLQKEPEI
ncbi:hypothetical protein FRC11_010540 [Ceratobasidium sp. 423]|nr:hypothetical protein FRC11_010540 [Ceratobasidium sp. 423]